ncbi:MAG TPA: YdiU family protein [Oligoflexus sp.]|uniref:protein adenylyltransferase SelO n=1 Tax=Oligoflexus sp. TaxID=1971216 RepID=UPI002D473D39|nr:YdiU family protein [Oligoflexus sp.]HYX35468.1 YdiU family protein [Oligoflexus sp.]
MKADSNPTLVELSALRLDDSFVRTLPADPLEDKGTRPVYHACFSFVKPTPVNNPKLIAWSDAMGQTLGLARPARDQDPTVEVLAGNRILPGMRPYAARYGGHQFGHWAGQLGDGRAITLAETINAQNQRWELQLKGAGPTPYSRRADGRAVLRSSIREFLCSEAMHHLGVPTTRALSLIKADDQVVRDMFYDGHPEMETCAIVTRVAPTFVRFGNFQILTAYEEQAELRQLADYVIQQHYPEFDLKAPDVYVSWFKEIARRTALMIAHWQRVGFVHGVMNTDNMSILGLTIDYGPYGWLDVFDPDWTPNTTDAQRRRYRFGNQPAVALWNIAQLGQALIPLFPDPNVVEETMNDYQTWFSEYYSHMMADKLGLPGLKDQDDLNLVRDLEDMLRLTPTDMTIFFRALADLPLAEGDEAKRLQAVHEAYYAQTRRPEHDEAIAAWLNRYAARCRADNIDLETRRRSMNLANPKYVLRNYLSQQAIDAADQGDFSLIERLLQVMQRPYDEHPQHKDLASRRPDWAENKAGCSALSCSS